MTDLIVDTSVWIDFFNGIDVRQVKILEENIENDENVIIIPTILQEILQGFSIDKDYEVAKQLLNEFLFVQMDAKETAIGAADLYRNFRRNRITIRKSNDCLIAYFAIKPNVPVLHRDRDFDIISKYTKLKIKKV